MMLLNFPSHFSPMIPIFLFFAIKVFIQSDKLRHAEEAECTTTDGSISTIPSNCARYEFIRSNCYNCKLSYTGASIIVFDECEFTVTIEETPITLISVDLIVNRSTLKLPTKNATKDSVKLISLLKSSIKMESSFIIGNKDKVVYQSAANIMSTNPKKDSYFNNCSFTDLHNYKDSRSGIDFQALSSQYYNYNVAFNNCIAKNCGVRIDLSGNGGFYAQKFYEGFGSFINCSFYACTSQFGGSLYLITDGIVQDCYFENGDCMSNGAAIFYSEPDKKRSLEITGCVFTYFMGTKSIVYINTNNSRVYGIKNCIVERCHLQSLNIGGFDITGFDPQYYPSLIFSNFTYRNNWGTDISRIIYGPRVTIVFDNCAFLNNSKCDYTIYHTSGLILTNCIFDCPDIGAIYTDTYLFYIENVTIKNFRAKTYNSLLCFDSVNENYKELGISNCTFINISANKNGGMGFNIYSKTTKVVINNCTFDSITSVTQTAAILSIPVTIQFFGLVDSTLINCYSLAGGSITIMDKPNVLSTIDAVFLNSTFINCTSKDGKGGIYLKYVLSSWINVTSCTFIDSPEENCQLISSTFVTSIEKSTFSNVGKIMDLTVRSNNYLLLKDLTFEDCSANSSMISLTTVSQFEFRNFNFKNVYCGDRYFLDTIKSKIELMIFQGCTFTNMTYKEIGLNINSSSAMFKNSIFTNCHAINGSCIYVLQNSYISINNVTFNHNQADQSGGCMLFETGVTYDFSQVKANHNYAGVDGAFICIQGNFLGSNLPEFTGVDNVSPSGAYSIVGSEDNEVALNNGNADDISLSNIGKLSITGSTSNNLSIKLNNVKNVTINTVKISYIEASGSSMTMDTIQINNATKIEIKMTDSCSLSNVQFLNSSNTVIMAPEVKISNCKFYYKRKSESQSQLVLESENKLKSPGVFYIKNSCFISNENDYGNGDHITSINPIVLNIDDNCCFDKDERTSISLAKGSQLTAPNEVFSCTKKCFAEDPEEDSEKAPKGIDKGALKYSLIAIGAVIVVVLVLVITVLIIKKIREDDLSISQNSIEIDRAFSGAPSSIILSDLKSMSTHNDNNHSNEEPNENSSDDEEFKDSDDIFNHDFVEQV